MPARTWTTPELIDASEHLLYEIEMLGHTAQLLYSHPGRTSNYWVDKTVYFALLESFALHARSLMHFFYPARRKQGDIFATDYIPGWTLPAKWQGFDRDRTRVSREILHLGINRLTVKRGWHYGRMTENINNLVRLFIDEVDENRLRTDFKASARAAMADPIAGWTSVPTQTFQSMARLEERQ